MDEPSCTQSIVVASFVSSLITAIIVVATSIAIYAGVWFCRKPHPNEVPGHRALQGSGNEGVYEAVDDEVATAISMKENEAYATTTTTT